MNLYENYFVSLSATERYRKHRFDVHEAKMKAVAQGFLAGYSDGSAEIVREVRGEQLLQVVESAFSHLQLLEGELRKETEIRFGTKKEIAARLPLFLKELKRLAAINQQMQLTRKLREEQELFHEQTSHHHSRKNA